jgi:class 3 adenylate cyclase/tetratricopeptide (TPR) repeat protein
MKCPRCQQESPSDADFCPECGAKLAVVCVACGTANAPAHKYCKKCGQALGVAAGLGEATPSRSPSSYTPKHLAERILTSKAALEGERKQVTVLFADLKGSMELLADRDPEEARQILDPVLELMMEAVHRYEGTVNQVMGDGIMALFGAPLAHEDHAVRACYAALTMVSTVGRANEDLRREHGVEVQIRVGLNSGEVVVRSIANDLHMDYSAIGQTTHLAARMEQLATPGTIRLTQETARLAEGFMQVRSLGAVAVKGLATPIEMLELVRAAPSRGRLQAAAGRGLTPFVGRQSEIAVLENALERAHRGHGQIVALVGEPGVGKSRLYWEFTHSSRTAGWVVLESSSVSYGKATAWGPLIDLLQRYLGIEEADDARRINEKIAGKLLTLDEALRSSVAPLTALLGIPVNDVGWQRLEPRERRQQTLDAVKRVLLRETHVAPVILVFEDLHWIDAETQAFLDALVSSVASARLLLLVNYRPEYAHGWTNLRTYSQLRIAPLGPEVAESLLEVLLGSDWSVAPLKRLLVERTEGNPFFLEESVRSLVETGNLIGDRGACRLARPLEAMAVPATVRAVLDARIDRLPAGDKRLLQCAAVIGKDVPFRLLETVADLPPDELHGALSRLAAAELLLEVHLFPELELSFRHAITHEVTYASLLTERRRDLHSSVMEALLHTPSAHGEPVRQLAHHSYRAGRWVESVAYLRRAAAAALQSSAADEAASCLDRAVDALAHLPTSSEWVTTEIDTRLELRNALFRLGRHAAIAEHLARAQALAEQIGDEGRLGWIHSHWAYYFGAQGDDTQSEAAAQTALVSATKTRDRGLELTATFHLAQLYARTAQYARAAMLNARLVDAGGSGSTDSAEIGSAQLVVARLWLLWCLAELGSFDEGLRRAEALARAVVEPFDRLTVQLGLGLLYLRQGRLAEAIPILEGVLPLCRAGNLAVWFPAIASPLGYAYALNGRLADGLSLLQQAVDATVQRGGVHPLRTAHLAEAHLLAGDMEKGRELANNALEAARTRRERAHEAYALRVLGRSTIETSSLEAGHLRAAIELADELGMRPLAAQTRLDLARAYERQGMIAERDAAAVEAGRLLESMAMRDWLGRQA